MELKLQRLEIGRQVEYKVFRGVEREEVFLPAEITQIVTFRGLQVYVMVKKAGHWMSGKEHMVLDSEINHLLRF